jgi:hypothetical protein
MRLMIFMKILRKIKKITALLACLILINPLPGFALEIKQSPPQEEVVPEYIAEAQWATVEKLQELLAEKDYRKALTCFSQKVQDELLDFEKENPNALVNFFEYWTLDENMKAAYKESVFHGKSPFIFDVNDQEWKINEH